MGNKHKIMRAHVKLLEQHSTTEWQSTSLELPDNATASSLADALRDHGVALPTNFQVVANGKEMGDNEAISGLGEFFFRTNAVYIRAIDENACREWQRTGRCKHGSKCTHADSHDVHRSPRYIAHTASSASNSPSPTLSPTISPATSEGATESSPSPYTQPTSPYTQEKCHECHEPSQAYYTSPVQYPAPQYLGHQQNDANHAQHVTICRNWARCGSCKFGSRCHFAATHTDANLPTDFHPSGQHHQHQAPPVQYQSPPVQHQCPPVQYPAPQYPSQYPAPQYPTPQPQYPTAVFLSSEGHEQWPALPAPMFLSAPSQTTWAESWAHQAPQQYDATSMYEEQVHQAPQQYDATPQQYDATSNMYEEQVQKFRKTDRWAHYTHSYTTHEAGHVNRNTLEVY